MQHFQFLERLFWVHMKLLVVCESLSPQSKHSERINDSFLPQGGNNKNKVISGQNISYFIRNSSPTSKTSHGLFILYAVYSYTIVRVSLSLSTDAQYSCYILS